MTTQTLLILAEKSIDPDARFEVTDKENEMYRAAFIPDDFHEFFSYDEDSDDSKVLEYIRQCAELNDMPVGAVKWNVFGDWIVHRLPDAHPDE